MMVLAIVGGLLAGALFLLIAWIGFSPMLGRPVSEVSDRFSLPQLGGLIASEIAAAKSTVQVVGGGLNPIYWSEVADGLMEIPDNVAIDVIAHKEAKVDPPAKRNPVCELAEARTNIRIKVSDVRPVERFVLIDARTLVIVRYSGREGVRDVTVWRNNLSLMAKYQSAFYETWGQLPDREPIETVKSKEEARAEAAGIKQFEEQQGETAERDEQEAGGEAAPVLSG